MIYFVKKSPNSPEFTKPGSSEHQVKWGNELLISNEEVYQDQDFIIALEGTFVGLINDKTRDSLSRSSQIQLIKEVFKKHRQDTAKELDGIHFLFIHDKGTGESFLFNNRYQASSGYYYDSDNYFIFSKMLENILEAPEFISRAYAPSVLGFLSNGFTISDKSQIHGVSKLLPSFFIKLHKGQSELGHHWDNEIQFNRQKFNNLEQKLDDYESVYRSSIENYFGAKKTEEAGTLLSGGHDTSFVMIQASKIHKKPIHGFTGTFPGWAFSEGDYAKNICEKFGGQFHEVPFLPEDVDLVVKLIRSCEEPVVGSSLPLFKIAQEAGQKVDTMMGGDGGDTLWGEYYPVGEYHSWVKNLPTSVRRFFHQVSKILLKVTDWERFWELEHVAGLFSENDFYDDFMRKLCTYRHFNDSYLRQLLSPDFAHDYKASRSRLEIPFTKENFDNSLIEGKLFNAFYTYQSFHTTRGLEYFGLELYLPTIQKDVIDFITNLPYEWVNGGTSFHRLVNSKTINRRLHKLALGRYLKREEIYNRSYDIPWYRILKPRHHVLDLLEKRLVRRGWFNESEIAKLFKEFRDQRAKDHELLELKHHGYRIFTLLSLEVWATEYLDGKYKLPAPGLGDLEDYLNSN
jgi:asparagine synthase (glutamine-hydrolysing)